VLAPRRLPGIRVDIAPLPVTEALPRMDVAVFVGFASTGPMHLPVLVASIAQYAAVFGPDAPLAWDEARGERVFAYLGAAVRAFFGNGGRRCWVIRVGRTAALDAARTHARLGTVAVATAATATSNRFPIPGVLEMRAGAGATPALAEARCEGSWSDSLTVEAALSEDPFAIQQLTAVGSPPNVSWSFRCRRHLTLGDLIELRNGALRVFGIVNAVTADLSGGEAPYHIELSICASFERVTSEPAPSPSAMVNGEATLNDDNVALQAALIGETEPRDTVRVRFVVTPARMPAIGQWLRWTDAARVLWIRIESLARLAVATSAGSPPGEVPDFEVEVLGTAWQDLTADPTVDPGSLSRAYRLEIELRTSAGAGQAMRLDHIGLSPQHERAWWKQASDAKFYRAASDSLATGREPVDSVRFPLSAPAASAPVQPIAWIPLGVEPLFSAALPALTQATTALERDGLARFDSSLFMDPELAELSTDAVSTRADALRFIQDEPRELFGLHAALSIGSGGLFNEASLLVVADAVHLGWELRDPADTPSAHEGQVAVPMHWRTHRGGCPLATDAELDAPDAGVFLDCATRRIATPTMFGPEIVVSARPYQLSWSASEAGASYEVSESRDSDLIEKNVIFAGTETQLAVDGRRDGIYYYTVVAYVGAEQSAPSPAIAVRVRQDGWRVRRPDEFSNSEESGLLRVHRSMLRVAGANGDLFAVMALPFHYRTEQAVSYVGRLKQIRGVAAATDAEAFAFNEAQALSYGAVYHPWLVSGSLPPPSEEALRTSNRATQRIVPPDGVVTGVLAARASTRGAWIAPANEALKDVVAVLPEIAAEDWQALQDAAVNVVRNDPRGFLTLCADTLSIDPDLRPINVRRLLTLLRRLTLRRGLSYVFEPNGATLRRAVQRGFDLLLTDMFRRGAFSGATQAQSFRVVTDDTINTPRDRDAGRFIVELRVAPSVPMRFVSLLLTQSGERLAVTEEL
jgi:hypothetical protein